MDGVDRMNCPVCDNWGMAENDDELVCQDCGAAFLIHYVGMYEEGSNERWDAGFEPEAWLEKFGKKLKDYKDRIGWVE